MGFRSWLHQLFADAKTVWGAPGANRPITRRWLAGSELSNKNDQVHKKARASKTASPVEHETKKGNVEG